MNGRKSTSLVLGLLVLFLLAGCAASRQERQVQRAISDYYVGNYASSKDLLRPLSQKTDENFVLNNLRLGSAALVDYDLDEAEAAFLRAYEVINSVGVNDGGRTLGAILVDEKMRIWKGEPFELAMANFYLGLLYTMRHEYDNARGAFENALFKLRDYGEGNDQGDRWREIDSEFALGYLMLGRTWQRLGREDLARANFDRVIQLQPRLRELADYDRHAQSNLLLVVDFGYGPQKVTDFDGAIVGFAPLPRHEGPLPRPWVSLDGQWAHLDNFDQPPVDLLELAQDRRWQSLDTIRTVKSAVGTGLMAVGAYQGVKHKPDYGAAAALIGAGLLLKATSQADVRQWEMLPRTVFVIPLRVPPGRHDITVEFPEVQGLRQTWRDLVVPDTGEATYYFRMQRWNSGPFTWPPPAMVGADGGS